MKHMRPITIMLGIIIAFSIVSYASANVYDSQQRADILSTEFQITPSDGVPGDRFGNFVSLSGDYALVGSRYSDGNTVDSGAAYIFKRDGEEWIEEAKLVASDGQSGDDFGYPVSLSSDYALVGARHNDEYGANAGAAYIFKRNGNLWTEEAKLIPSDIAADDKFGWSVSMSSDYALIGSRQDDDNGYNSGSAYVFRRDGTSWIEEAKLVASDGASNDLFAQSLSLFGDRALVGAPWDDDKGSQSGSAYIFRRDGATWIQEAKLVASDGVRDDNFGYSVSISSDYAAIGSFYDDDKGTDSGSVYVLKRDGTTWTEETKLVASDGTAKDWFGLTVSLSSDCILVGSGWDDDKGTDSGSAYLFQRDGTSWIEGAKLTANEGIAYEHFGYSVSISGNFVLLGTYDENSGHPGSAYIYRLKDTAPTIEDIIAYITALPDSAFKNNPEQRKNAFSQKLDEVQVMIDSAQYQEAIEKLEDDILSKTDGCFGGKENNDWIKDCNAQEKVYPLIINLIKLLESFLENI